MSGSGSHGVIAGVLEENEGGLPSHAMVHPEGPGAGEGGQTGGDQGQVEGAHQAVPPGQGLGEPGGEGGGSREVCSDPAGGRTGS